MNPYVEAVEQRFIAQQTWEQCRYRYARSTDDGASQLRTDQCRLEPPIHGRGACRKEQCPYLHRWDVP